MRSLKITETDVDEHNSSSLTLEYITDINLPSLSAVFLSYLQLSQVSGRGGPSQYMTVNQCVLTQKDQQAPQDRSPHVILLLLLLTL